MEKRTLICYVRNKSRQPVGVLYAEMIDGVVEIGWSKYNEERETKSFSKKQGLMVAKNRATTQRGTQAYPDCMKKPISNFVHRCELFFKTTNIMVN